MTILRVHHAQVSIPKGAEEQARKFYCEVLGLKEIEKPESLKGRGGFWLALGDLQVHFGTEDGIDRNLTKSHIAYEVKDLAQWKEKLQKNGIEILVGIPIPDYDRFEFRDPFGNRVEFLHRQNLRLERFTLPINDDTHLVLINLERASEFMSLIDRSRSYLRDWLAWLDATRTVSDLEKFIDSALKEFSGNKAVAMWIINQEKIVGIIHLREIEPANRKAVIGYWVGQEYQGHGFARKATHAICDYGFNERKLNRIEIRCATGNIASQAVPVALGFKKEGELRDNEWLYDHFVNHIVFSMLAINWAENKI